MTWLESGFEKRWFRVVATFFVVVYVLSPIDLLPEFFIPGFGVIDDGVLVSFFIVEIAKHRRKKAKIAKNNTAIHR